MSSILMLFSYGCKASQGLMRLAMSAFDYSDSSAHGAFSVFRVEKLLKEPKLSNRSSYMTDMIKIEII